MIMKVTACRNESRNLMGGKKLFTKSFCKKSVSRRQNESSNELEALLFIQVVVLQDEF